MELREEINVYKIKQFANMVGFIDTILSTEEIDMSNKIKQAMNQGTFNQHKVKYTVEAKEKWGDTKSYKQSQNRMAKYSKYDIQKLNQQQAKIYEELAELTPLGPDDLQVQIKAHQARMFISDNWYDCSTKQFSALGNMYVADERYKANIDKHGKGLARFINQAISIYVKNSD